MNIEIANRLQKLRKEKGYSQEQLADLLGISRQAISKWERAEASPDTDNLIELAKLYSVSIDYLVGIKEEDNTKVLDNGIHIVDDEDEIHISKDGIQIHEKKEKEDIVSKIYYPVVTLVCVIAYILIGALASLWHPGWLIFLLMVTLFTLFDAIKHKKVSDFAYPIFITTIYLFLGFSFSLWTPWWFLFITIPLFYVVASIIDHHVITKHKN